MGRDQSITTPHRHAATPHPTQIPSPTPMINLSYAALGLDLGIAGAVGSGAGGMPPAATGPEVAEVAQGLGEEGLQERHGPQQPALRKFVSGAGELALGNG